MFNWVRKLQEKKAAAKIAEQQAKITKRAIHTETVRNKHKSLRDIDFDNGFDVEEIPFSAFSQQYPSTPEVKHSAPSHSHSHDYESSSSHSHSHSSYDSGSSSYDSGSSSSDGGGGGGGD